MFPNRVRFSDLLGRRVVCRGVLSALACIAIYSLSPALPKAEAQSNKWVGWFYQSPWIEGPYDSKAKADAAAQNARNRGYRITKAPYYSTDGGRTAAAGGGYNAPVGGGTVTSTPRFRIVVDRWWGWGWWGGWQQVDDQSGTREQILQVYNMYHGVTGYRIRSLTRIQ